jgi:ABC-type polysaccharide/polyol phosphate transport system ATPase subunit
MWAAELTGVGKVFRIRRNRASHLKVRLLGLVSPQHREHWERFAALSDVSLRIAQGEVLGLIGPNGSGKSTLLRLIAGIFQPSSGEVTVHGRVVPLIELGVGFHPDLTGRENIHLNTSLFGLTRRQALAIYRDVVAFAELEDFIDVPVKNYSSGMYVRLGFAVAVHLEADLLLLDEVMAVGDARFQDKCLRRLEELRSRGVTIVIVSHSLPAVEQICSRACLLVHGRLVADGPPPEVIGRYREILAGANPA